MTASAAASSSPSRQNPSKRSAASNTLSVTRSRPPSQSSRSGGDEPSAEPRSSRRKGTRHREASHLDPLTSSPSPHKPRKGKRAKDGEPEGMAIPGALDTMHDLDSALPPLSQSAPARGRGPARDESWDMPDTPAKRHEALTWQQQAAAAASPKSVRSSPRKTQPSAPSTSYTNPPTILQRPKPARPVSATHTSTLTWQQELMKSSPATRSRDVPAWAAETTPSPQPQPTTRRRPASTSVEPFAMDDDEQTPATDDVFAKQHRGSAPAAVNGVQTRARHKSAGGILLAKSHSLSGAASGKKAKAVDASGGDATKDLKYAGPLFHSSPSPASLPTPTILTRRTAAASS